MISTTRTAAAARSKIRAAAASTKRSAAARFKTRTPARTLLLEAAAAAD